ncbi:F0F1-type ATP synthase membrane subunit b/b' [Allocatelliglobosispora scoriae]|uniref:F0F1-type ATP synthase membrane subunit b/b n=1 Tax=Allocatelliglobosispora scoriae TaxID=643052 RepID=A0A841BUH4_9ACTN|nr:hypothetical protein [Allocatelliglobosispora scoriae]MBB5870563.1 F0F1-type ATP synthase membrane subunit b/b' [Allocatelliglobosispora scoriae]
MNATTTPKSDTTEKNEYPSAVYAAAGIGDLAYQQLRKLPEYADKLRAEAEKLRERAPEFRAQASQKAETLRTQAGGQFNAFRADATGETGKLKAKAAELGAQATDKAAELTTKVDIEKIRTTLVTGAQTVTERAMKLYDDLVARGEKVVVPEHAGATAEPKVSDIDPEAAATAAETTVVETMAAEAAPVVEGTVEKPVKPAAPRKPKGNGSTTK